MSYSVAVIGRHRSTRGYRASEHAPSDSVGRGQRHGARLLAPNGGGRSITNAGSTEHLIQSHPARAVSYVMLLRSSLIVICWIFSLKKAC